MQKASGLLRSLQSPAKIARLLEWKQKSGSILVLDIGRERIGLALAGHPRFDQPVEELEPITLKLIHKEDEQSTSSSRSRLCRQTGRREHHPTRRVLARPILQELNEIAEGRRVCGLVISWPLQKEGRMGAPCGKVLHTLESLVSESPTLVNSKRPFCLWDDHHYTPYEDNWGRNSRYGVPATTKRIHMASQEQYAHVCNSSVAANVWDDFCTRHWPPLEDATNHHERRVDSSF